MPAIPVAIMLNHRKTEQVHEALLRKVLDMPFQSSILKKKILFVSDRKRMSRCG